jgi:hypothetical protein
MKATIKIIGILFFLGLAIMFVLANIPTIKFGLQVMDQAQVTVDKLNAHTAEVERQAVELGFTLDGGK